MRMVAAIFMGMVMLCVAACADRPVSAGGFNAADPASKLYAITRAGQQRDASKVGDLIQQLDSDDQAVRMYAITALQRITGTRMGYVYYDPPARRVEAVTRWAKAYESGNVPIAQADNHE